MIHRICAWCAPPRLMETVDDGKCEIIETHGICAACLDRLKKEPAQHKKGETSESSQQHRT